jgi:hypothetical protein
LAPIGNIVRTSHSFLGSILGFGLLGDDTFFFIYKYNYLSFSMKDFITSTYLIVELLTST